MNNYVNFNGDSAQYGPIKFFRIGSKFYLFKNSKLSRKIYFPSHGEAMDYFFTFREKVELDLFKMTQNALYFLPLEERIKQHLFFIRELTRK